MLYRVTYGNYYMLNGSESTAQLLVAESIIRVSKIFNNKILGLLTDQESHSQMPVAFITSPPWNQINNP